MKLIKTISPEKKKQIDEITNMFKKIDLDNSGEVDLPEIYELVRTSGLMISKDEIKNLFFKKDSNTLSLNEFLNASNDKVYRSHFRQVMRNIKKKMKLIKFNGSDTSKNKTDFTIGNSRYNLL
jgi:Ca2+-binding EF-hand superfamily protein